MYSANPAPITFVSAPACHVMNEVFSIPLQIL